MERLSDAKRGELWDRWEAGESQRSIADTSGLSGTRPLRMGFNDRYTTALKTGQVVGCA
jgi:hypothetical protein